MKLADLDFNTACETPHEFEVVSPVTGKPRGVFISVLGDGAARVQEVVRRELNKRREVAGMIPIEMDVELSIESAVARTHSWREIDEPCTPENARKLYTMNPMIRQQVLAASNTAGNFIKA